MVSTLQRVKTPVAVRQLATLLAAVALLFTGLVAIPGSPAVAATTGQLTATVAVDGDVLLGEPVEVTLTVKNSTANPHYNLSFRYVLPAGVTYVSSASGFGAPRQIDGPNGTKVLIWDNISDLPANAEQTLVFTVRPNHEVHLVGAQVPAVASAYTSNNERWVPPFDADGNFEDPPAHPERFNAAVADDKSTKISAIKVEKFEPSPEHELVRGVHDETTTYSLLVTNNSHFDDDNVVVVDLLPAQLEFLGCGDVDNSTPGEVEYAGAPRLDANPGDDLAAADCPEPHSVTTVENPTDPATGATLSGVYTRVEWRLGTLKPGQVVEINYRAGIPMLANTYGGDFTEDPNGALDALGQAANLDNNTGASTRETLSERELTNHVLATADYTGPVADGTSPQVSDTDKLTVTAEDLAIQKSVNPTTFEHGKIATFTFELQTGEYASADNIVITDTLPDGLCPLGMGLADCDNAYTGTDPISPPAGATVSPSNVTANADGTHTIVFDPIAMLKSDTRTITFQALMGVAYKGASKNSAPTVAGDTYTNEVSLTGTTTSVDGLVHEVDPEAVQDTSSASLSGGTVKLDKRILPHASPWADSTDADDYVQGSTLTPDELTFNKGSRVDFLLEVRFPAGMDTKNAVLKDFLPENLTYIAGSARAASENTLPLAQVDITYPASAAGPVFTLGEVKPAGRFVSKGEVFQYVISAIVNSSALPGKVDEPGNLAKLTWTNTEGDVSFLRDKEDFRVPSPPPLEITKTDNDADNNVVAGDTVEFTIDVKNNGTEPIHDPVVWDVLPAGIAFTNVTGNPSGANQVDPANDGYADRDVMQWTLTGVTLQPGESLATPGKGGVLKYTVTYPATVAAGASYTNDAGVRTYKTKNNLGGDNPHFPVDNIDPDPTIVEDAPEALDDETVKVPAVELTKTNVTEVTPENSQGTAANTNYAVPGEKVTYTIVAKLPADTTIYQGVLTDTLPSNLNFDSLESVETTTTGDTGWASVSSGSVATWQSDSQTVTLQTPLTVTDARWFRLTIKAHVKVTGTGSVHGTKRTNTATFASKDQSGDNLPGKEAKSEVTLVEPQPKVTKTAGNMTPGIGDVFTYTITASNERKPALHDVYAIDCVPAGLEVDESSINASVGTAAVVTPNTAECAAGTTQIRWEWPAGSSLEQGTNRTLTYQVKVLDGAGSDQGFKNTVDLHGTSMPGAPDGDRPYEATTDVTVQVPKGSITKSVTPGSAPVGDQVEFTVDVTLPANANFYDAKVVDTLPVGINPSSITDVQVTCLEGGVACAPALAVPTGADNGQTYTWTFGTIPTSTVERKLTITYKAVVRTDNFGAGNADRNDAGEQLVNSAVFQWKSAPADPTPKTTGPATSTVTVLEPKLSISKLVNKLDEDEVEHGEEFTYTIVVSNAAGPNVSTAHDVDVRDVVPGGVVVTEASIDNGGDYASALQTINWHNLGPIAPGDSITLTYKAKLKPGERLAQTNIVTIDEYWSLPNNGGREYDGPNADAKVTPELPELTIDKKLEDDAPAYRGESVRWSITVTNGTGKPTAHDVDIVDELPADWTYDANSARVSIKGVAATAIEPTVSGQTLTWTNLADLAAGESIVIEFTATPGDTAVVGGATAHTNKAKTTGKDLDGGEVVTEDEDDASTQIDSADLQITKAVSPSGAVPVAGSDFAWSLTVKNNGADTAVGPFLVVDTLPAGVTYEAGGATGTGWTITESATGIEARRTNASDTLASGASFEPITVKVTVNADVTKDTELTNTATVEGKTFDPDKDNNKDEEKSTVEIISDFGIEKTLSGKMVPGNDVTYAINVHNHGPSYSEGDITVTETLPAGLTYKSFTGAGWDLDDKTGQVLTFKWVGTKPVPVGAMQTINLTASVASSLTAAVTNEVEVDEPTDPTTGPEEPDEDDVTTTPEPSADLALTKTRVGPMTAGTTDSYTFTVVNNGPSDAAGPLTLVDTLPAGLTFVPGSGTDGWNCSAVGQTVTCTHAGGLVAQTAGDANKLTFAFEVEIAQDRTGLIENVATVTSPTPDPDPSDNSDNDKSTDPNDVKADLQITKTLTDPVAPDKVIAGENVTYELVVKNNGPSQSKADIVVTDILPEGLTFVSATDNADWALARNGQTLTFTRSSALASGATAPTITVTVKVGSGVGTQTLINTAKVDGPDDDPDTTNNTDPEPTPVTEDTEIVLEKKRVGPNPVIAGENATFEITVRNTGSSDARSVQVTDTLPAGMTLVSITGTDWTCVAGVCTIDRIVAGETAPTLTVVAKVASNVADGTTLVNEAVTTTITPGDDPSDNDDDAPVDVITKSDLAITKVHPTGSAIAGTPTAYQITVVNNGPSDNTGPITVTDTLPAGLSYLSANAPWVCAPSGLTVTCELPRGLVAGETAPVLDLRVFVAASVDAGKLVNTATVDSPVDDPNPGNNEDDEPINAERVTNVSITKTHSGQARVGDELTFTLAVTNDGPSTARDVVVTDTLPTGLEFVSATGDGWRTEHVDGTVTASLQAPLEPGADAAPITVVVKVGPEVYPSVVNVAQVETSTPDTNPDDNEDRDPVDVPALVDLSIDKELLGDLVVGEQAEYQLTVTNHGPTANPGAITVTDQLPSSLVYVDARGEVGTWTEGDGLVTFTLPDGLEVDESATFTITVEVLPSAYPEVTNGAVVSTESEETDPDNNTDEVTDPVTPSIDLSIEKKVQSLKGDRVTYRITVSNAGPSATVEPVVAKDKLPKGLELLEVRANDWSCSNTARVVTCLYGDPIEAGQSVRFDVVTKLVAKPGESVTNVATVVGGEPSDGDDPSTDDPVEEDEVTVTVPNDTDDPEDKGGKDPGDKGDGKDGTGDNTGPNLPSVGGPQLLALVGGLGLLLVGALLLTRRRRSA